MEEHPVKTASHSGAKIINTITSRIKGQSSCTLSAQVCFATLKEVKTNCLARWMSIGYGQNIYSRSRRSTLTHSVRVHSVYRYIWMHWLYCGLLADKRVDHTSISIGKNDRYWLVYIYIYMTFENRHGACEYTLRVCTRLPSNGVESTNYHHKR